MRKILITSMTIITIVSIILAQVEAQDKVSTPSPTKSNASKQVEELKEKLAETVQELSRKNQKAVAGYVDTISKTNLKLKGEDENVDIKLESDITKFYKISGGEKEEIESEDIEKGEYVVVNGLLVDEVINANFIYLDEEYVVDAGRVVAVDVDNNSLDVLTLNKDRFTLDIETTTKQQIVNIKTLAIETSGFSKIKEGDTISFVYKKGEKNNDTISVDRILITPQEYFIK